MDEGPSSPAPNKSWLNRNVLGAGLTSALGDLCYETATVILPGFLAVLHIPAAGLGLIEGVADAVSSSTKLIAGYLADKFGRRKLLVAFGYALTPLGQALISLATALPLILLGRTLSWFGKGLRGPLRDAILSQSIHPAARGRVFGFHRALDTVGAILGPLLGVALLGWAQGRAWPHAADAFRLVLWWSLVPGVFAVAAFLIFVQDSGASPNPSLHWFRTLRALPSRFSRYLRAIGLFGLGDFSHSLLILAATQILTPAFGLAKSAQIAGMLYVVRNVLQSFASYPVGVLADRLGLQTVLLSGYALGVTTALLTATAFLFHWSSVLPLAVLFAVAGIYTAIQEALEPALTPTMAEGSAPATAQGAVGAVNGLARLLSSAGVGALWTAISPEFAFALAAVPMLCGTFALWRLRD